MSEDIAQHEYAPAVWPDRCAECFMPEAHSIHLLGPCGCWSCDAKCGNDQADCGPLQPGPRGPLCESCREAADVIGDRGWSQGVKIETNPGHDDTIVLAAGVWGQTKRVGLNLEEALVLAQRLLAARAEIITEAGAASTPDADHSSDGSYRYPVNHAGLQLAEHAEQARAMLGGCTCGARPSQKGSHWHFAGCPWAAPASAR